MCWLQGRDWDTWRVNGGSGFLSWLELGLGLVAIRMGRGVVMGRRVIIVALAILIRV